MLPRSLFSPINHLGAEPRGYAWEICNKQAIIQGGAEEQGGRPTTIYVRHYKTVKCAILGQKLKIPPLLKINF